MNIELKPVKREEKEIFIFMRRWAITEPAG